MLGLKLDISPALIRPLAVELASWQTSLALALLTRCGTSSPSGGLAQKRR